LAAIAAASSSINNLHMYRRPSSRERPAEIVTAPAPGKPLPRIVIGRSCDKCMRMDVWLCASHPHVLATSMLMLLIIYMCAFGR
jgi:hypothetical protein